MIGAAADLPNLGTATADDAVQCASYLVTSSRSRFRRIRLNDGSDVFAMDQFLNPDSVTLTPGGVRAPDAVIAGALSTASDSPSAQALMRDFHAALRQSFHKIRAYYVGPRAEALFDAGWRLTAAIQSPREFDLARE